MTAPNATTVSPSDVVSVLAGLLLQSTQAPSTAELDNLTTGDDDDDFITESPNISNVGTTDYIYDYEEEQYSAILDVWLVIIGVAGVICNGLVVIVIMRFTSMTKKLTGMFILNQTLVDLMASLALMINYSIFSVYQLRVPNVNNFLRELYCRLFSTEWLHWGLLISSSHSLLLINLERYISVVHPIFHTKLKRRAFTWPAIGIVWLVGPLFWFMWGIPSSTVDGDYCILYGYSERLSMINGLMYLTVNYFIPLAAITYFYIAMIWKLKKRERVVNPSIGGIALPAYKKISPAKKNLLKTMVMVTLVFVLCLSWDQIMWLLYVVGVTKTYYGNLFYYSFMLTCINSCINPFIYIIHYKEFKAGIKKLLNKSSSIVMPWSTQSTFST